MPENKDIIKIFENSPIFLAILEIRYSHSNLKNIEIFSEVKKDLVKLFPTSQKQVTSQLKLDSLLQGQTTISIHNQKVDCFLYTSEDKLTEFTISLDKFNYKQSGSYSNFGEFIKNIKEVWEIHYPILKDISIVGISLRCFNKIEIKENISDPSEYFNISIQAGQDVIKDLVINYSIRYITKNPDENKHSIIALTLEERLVDQFPFVLDIDVHDDGIISNDLNLLWEKFEALRIEKDRLFNAILTEKTKNIFL
jgi:uncharacterized protein (TIGR04255 family)